MRLLNLLAPLSNLLSGNTFHIQSNGINSFNNLVRYQRGNVLCFNQQRKAFSGEIEKGQYFKLVSVTSDEAAKIPACELIQYDYIIVLLINQNCLIVSLEARK